MSISEIRLTYDTLWKQAIQSIEKNSLNIDPHLVNKSGDLRRGLTLVCRPSCNVQGSVMTFLNEARKIEPNQYAYFPMELHTTVLTIITCTEQFHLSAIDIPSYVEVIAQSASSISPFQINYQGISASPECVMIQGYPQGVGLQELRDRVREHFRESEIISTLDERFKTHTSHMTCLRFQDPLTSQPERFIHFLEQYREFDFGTSEGSELEFVVNDWYMSHGNVKVLHRFQLPRQKRVVTFSPGPKPNRLKHKTE